MRKLAIVLIALALLGFALIIYNHITGQPQREIIEEKIEAIDGDEDD